MPFLIVENILLSFACKNDILVHNSFYTLLNLHLDTNGVLWTLNYYKAYQSEFWPKVKNEEH